MGQRRDCSLSRLGSSRRLATGIAALLLVGCANAPLENTVQTNGRLPPVDEIVAENAAAEGSDLSQVSAQIDTPAQPHQTELFYGDQTFVTDPAALSEPYAVDEEQTGGESFVFRNAPIDAVINEILGEAFSLSYSVAPDVKGSITLRLDGISSAEQAVASLDAALGLQGFEITRSGNEFLVGRSGSMKSDNPVPVFVGEGDEMAEPSSMAVLQVRFAQLADVTSLASAMLPSGIIKFQDESRGFVVLQGEPAAVASAVRLLKALDVNWLSSVSTAMIPIENARPTEIAADLEPLISKLGGVSVVPIDRLSTLMVISRRRDTLDQARQWVSRLDRSVRPQLTNDTLVYEARYVAADYLASIVSGQGRNNRGFGGNGGGFGGGAGNFGGPGSYQDGAGPQGGQNGVGQNGPGLARGLYDQLAITVDDVRNTVIARGPNEDLQSLSALFETIDKPQRQVLIEATIVEVALTETNQVGVQWDVIADELRATFSDVGSGAVTSLFPGASVSFVNSDIQAVVNVLALTSDVEIVSSPRVLVLNNETARLQIGDQVPVITQSAVSVTDPGAPVVNSTSYRDTGVILTVTPSIRAGGLVEIQITQEVSSVAETTTSSIDSPTISQRTVESRLAVPDGSTAVLGGLISSTRSFTETGVPVLKDVPYLGDAFRSTATNDRRTELVILVEPTVVLSEDPVVDLPQRLRQALVDARLDG